MPKNLKSLKEALPASKYEIETNFEKQVANRESVERKVESRLHSVRSLGRVETPKIQDLRKFISQRPDSANQRPVSAHRREESSARREESSNKKLPRMPCKFCY